jgi:signal transduction histidine kinase
VIQSFVALQLGLSTSREKLAAGGPDAALWVDRLRELTDAGLADIRAHMRGLQGAGEHEGSLVSAVRRFAQKFTEATGIAVQLETTTNLHIDDRLAAEVFQLVTEGLNNIRAHTESTKALVGLEKKNDMFILRIEHERTGSAAPEPSTPGSLTEHAAALGGHAYIDSHVDGRTGVIVEIPL